MPKNDWSEYKKLVLFEIQENGKRFTTISDTLISLQKDVSGLKVKAAIAGGLAGIVGTGVVSMILSAFKSVH